MFSLSFILGLSDREAEVLYWVAAGHPIAP
jgi:DNA-binding CsgD family transcriptional regulator